MYFRMGIIPSHTLPISPVRITQLLDPDYEARSLTLQQYRLPPRPPLSVDSPGFLFPIMVPTAFGFDSSSTLMSTNASTGSSRVNLNDVLSSCSCLLLYKRARVIHCLMPFVWSTHEVFSISRTTSSVVLAMVFCVVSNASAWLSTVSSVDLAMRSILWSMLFVALFDLATSCVTTVL